LYGALGVGSRATGEAKPGLGWECWCNNRTFLRRLHTALSARDLTLVGVTTDASALSPTPLVEVCGEVPHHICTFHIVAEVGKAV